MHLANTKMQNDFKSMKMNNTFLTPYGILLIVIMALPFEVKAEVINVPCISSQGSAGGWWYPTIKEEFFPLVLVKADVWTRGLENHPLYTPKILEQKPGKPVLKLASCAVVPAYQEAWK